MYTCDGVVCDELIQCYDFVIFFLGFSVYIFVDLVKCSVLIFVSEVCCYRNGRHCYYCRNDIGCISHFSGFHSRWVFVCVLVSVPCGCKSKDGQLRASVNTR